MNEPMLVIGAGIGGLSAAIRLAAAGRKVTVLEQNERVGGKMGEFRASGYRWDTGPSVITMRNVFEELFTCAGRQLEHYLDLQPVEPLTRYYFANGSRLDATRDLSHMLAQIQAFDVRDVEGYLGFLAYAARLYRITSPVFIFDRPPGLHSLWRVSPLDALRFDGLRSMEQAINGFVQSPQIRQLLSIFATYVGASPYQAPAALNVIAHVELAEGVWYPRGGVYRIAEAFERLARELGVEIFTGARVRRIEVQAGRVRGVELEDGTRLPAAAVVANLDVALVYERLLDKTFSRTPTLRRLQRAEPSCSAYVMLLGIRGQHPQLAHHTTFFSSDYRREFRRIFAERVPPDEPTVYVSITSRATPEDAPSGCENWFIQINVPAISERWDWQTRSAEYGELVLALLARRGVDLTGKIEFRKDLTPLDLERLSASRQGALYGASSNSRWAAFRRPGNRSREVKGLYFCGGTAHPGGGVPMAALSGKVASQMLLEDGF